MHLNARLVRRRDPRGHPNCLTRLLRQAHVACVLGHQRRSLSDPVSESDLSAAGPLLRAYLRLLVRPSQILLERREFVWIINTATMLAVVTVGVSSYIDQPEESFRPYAEQLFAPFWYLDLVIVVIFMVEVLVRILAKKFRPLRFFYDEFHGGWHEGARPA